MADKYLLGIDIGTYESKGVITTVDGEIVSTQVRPHDLTIPRQGWAEHDAESIWWGDFVTLSRRLLGQTGIAPEAIQAVGCSAIGPCLLPVDANANPLREGGILYGIDTRATDEIVELEERLGRDLIFEKTGNQLSSQMVGPKILWLKRNEPEVYAKAHKFITSTAFIVARLTGNFVMDHLTAAAWAPLYDFHNQTWNEELCDGIVEPARLPNLGWGDELAGTVTAKAAEETGLAAGTPVIVGTVDAPAEAVSVGVTSPGQMMLMYGSTVFMIEVLDRPLSDERLWAVPYVFEGTSCLEAGMATSGALTRWFRDKLARELIAIEEETGENAYGALTEAAAEVPAGSEGVLVLPYFSGERTPINDPRARGVFFGLTLAHSRAHMYRAVLEGIAYGIKHHIEVLDSIDAKPTEIAAVGGGTKSDLWLQIVSDVTGLPQRVPAVTTGASYGDAFLAGLGTNIFSSYNDIDRWVRDERIVEPRAEHAELYEKYYRLYRDLYTQTKGIMHELHSLA